VNVVLAVVLDEPERGRAIQAAQATTAFASKSFPFEIGNALARLAQRKRLSSEGMLAAWRATQQCKVLLCDIDIAAVLRLAAAHNIYADDSYILQCAIEQRASRGSLDRRMIAVGKILASLLWSPRMRVDTFSEARQKLTEVLDFAR
jgi:predicted nucleic acid-binding protein